jgi:hypothetical protein
MKAPDYTRKLAVLDAKVKLLLAQKAELIHKRDTAKATPAPKRPKPKAPSKKKPALKTKPARP